MEWKNFSSSWITFQSREKKVIYIINQEGKQQQQQHCMNFQSVYYFLLDTVLQEAQLGDGSKPKADGL